ncbi:class II aldolase/adducin family protein [Kibdelosporangium philippinense]|uniref:Class II aldolase/adducin family protein n=1 Tax=Kibdelosporangium philippinense TaxID=211113 RepID=A0ABS8ZTM1_9PSEU|nr:class II aldolase/adducin family protein [Kibdelosporangium philippinense]MCE7011070.1 class II aldolase/adducin family protein [Kibdelosporangium philippinense]
MNEQVADVVRAHHALAVAGHDDMVWGHVSIRDRDGRGIWIKASGWCFDEIDPDRVLLVSWDGEVLEGEGKRHIEYPIHTRILTARPDVDCVIHTHAMAASAFASLEVPIRAINHDGVLFTEPDIPRFTRTGSLIRTKELGDALAETLGDARACLIPQHGLVAVGMDVAHAVMHTVLLDRACSIQLTAMAAGGPKRWSDPAEVALKVAECWPPSQIEAGWDYLARQGRR